MSDSSSAESGRNCAAAGSSPPSISATSAPSPIPLEKSSSNSSDLDLLEDRLKKMTTSTCTSTNSSSNGSTPPTPLLNGSNGEGPPSSNVASSSTSNSGSLTKSRKSLLPKPNVDVMSKSCSTSSMLKSTLKRITRLSTSNKTSSPPSNPIPVQETKTSLARSKSFKDPQASNSLKNNSQSLRRNSARRETSHHSAMTRSGTAGDGLNRQHRRSQSMRRIRDRDARIRKSRGVQTSLTKDVMTDKTSDQADVHPEFSVYMPDLLGTTNDVETIGEKIILIFSVGLGLIKMLSSG